LLAESAPGGGRKLLEIFRNPARGPRRAEIFTHSDKLAGHRFDMPE
jgi:hypothetical protein